MSWIDGVEAAAREAAALVRAAPALVEASVPDYLALAQAQGTLRRPARWWNVLANGGFVARAHVEFFALPEQIGVIHVCAFPKPQFSAPVFGFDLIAGGAKATGAFLDWTATDAASAELTEAWALGTAQARGAFGVERTLPDWAAIFSPHVLAVRPRGDDEIAAALTLGLESLRDWLALEPAAAQAPAATLDAQRRYVAGQRANTHTLRMLSDTVGETLAQRFVAEQLFPEPVAAQPLRR